MFAQGAPLARRKTRWLLGALCLVPACAFGAGFAIDFVGARSVSTATAGSASAADASTVFSNPAGLAYMPGNEWMVGGDLFLLRDRFRNDGSTILGGLLPTPGTEGKEAIPTAVVPWIFGRHRLTDQLVLGLGIFSPFGLKTDYGADFVGRYQNQLTSLKVIDVNPVLAYHPTSWLALAVGVNVEYASLRLTQAIDMGSICAAALGPVPCGGAGLVPGRSDASTRLDAHDVAVGFNVGLMLQPRAQSRFGIAYRNSVRHGFDDAQQSFDVSPAGRTFLTAIGMPNAFTGGGASTDLPLPARLSFGWQETASKQLTLFADAVLTKWHVFQKTVVTPHDAATGAAVVIEQGYEDAWRFAVGGEYKWSDAWATRAGVAYDHSPIPERFIQAALPDRDRIYLSTGVTYASPGGHWRWDLGYSYVHYKGRIPIDRAGPTGDRLRGDFDVGGHVIAAQVRYGY